MSFFQFLHPMFKDDDNASANDNKKQRTPTIFLQLDDLFAGVSVQKPKHCPVFKFKEGIWADFDTPTAPPSITPEPGSWNQSKFFVVIPEGPYYAPLRNYVGSRKMFKKAELVVQTKVKEVLMDSMTYTFQCCRIEGVAIDHEEKRLELILMSDIIKLAIKAVDPITDQVGGMKVSEVNVPENKVC